MRTGRLGSLCRIMLIAALAAPGMAASSGCAADPAGSNRLTGSREDDTYASDDESAGAREDDDEVLTPANGDGDTGDSDLSPSAAEPEAPCEAKDLALCFTFEGSTADQSPARLRPAVNVGVGFVNGKDGQGATFGVGSALRFSPDPAFELPSASATIEAWIKRTSSGSSAVVFDDDGRFSLTIDSAGRVTCKTSNGAVTGTSIVPLDTWVHVACVLDNATLGAYVDGNVEATGGGAIGSSPTSGAAVGGNSPTGEPFVGTIDLLRVFRAARTPAQIAAAAKGT